MTKRYGKGECVYFEVDDYMQRHISACGVFLRDVSQAEFDTLVSDLSYELRILRDEERAHRLCREMVSREMLALLPVQHTIWTTTDICLLSHKGDPTDEGWVPDDGRDIYKKYDLFKPQGE